MQYHCVNIGAMSQSHKGPMQSVVFSEYDDAMFIVMLFSSDLEYDINIQITKKVSKPMTTPIIQKVG